MVRERNAEIDSSSNCHQDLSPTVNHPDWYLDTLRDTSLRCRFFRKYLIQRYIDVGCTVCICLLLCKLYSRDVSMDYIRRCLPYRVKVYAWLFRFQCHTILSGRSQGQMSSMLPIPIENVTSSVQYRILSKICQK
jgi:hypothetical protein